MARASRLTGGGEVGALIRSHNWSQTPLSSIEAWSPSLRTALSIVLNSPCPMFITWGPNLILFYNDACLPFLGHKHPNALGQPAKDCWAEVWHESGSDFEQVLVTGEPIHRENTKWLLDGNSCLAEHSFTLSHSAIADERGMVGGVLTVVTDEVSVLGIDISDAYQQATQRKQAEMALRRSETVLSAFLASSPVGMAFLDHDLRYIYANEALAAINGVPLSEHVNRTVWEVLPEWAPQIQAVAHQVMQTKEPLLNQEVNGVTNPANVYRSALVNYFPVCLPDGQVIGVGVTSMDITDRKQVEVALRLSENRYRTLANAVPQLMWTSAPDGTTQFFNQRWVEYTGIPLELGLQIWTQIIHPEDAQSALELRTRTIQAGEAFDMKVRLRRFDQTYRWHLARVVPIKGEDGQVIQWFGTATDIHDVKQTEAALQESSVIAKARAEELEALMEITPTALWIAHDPNCHHITANQTAYKLMRAEPGSITTATPPDGLNPLKFRQRRNGQDVLPDDLPMQRAARTGQEVTDEMEFVFEDGTVRFIYGKAVPLWNEAGSVRGVIGSFVDITDRKQAEESLRQSEERLRLAMEGAQMGTWDVDLVTGKAIWSEQHFTMLGYEPVPTGEATEEMWSSRIHPDDLLYVSQEWQQSRQEHRLYRTEYRVIRVDNQQIAWLAALGSFTYDQNGQAIRSIGILFEITDRKQAEAALRYSAERLKLAQQAAGAGLWDWDIVANRVTWSEEYYQLYGLDLGVTPSYENWLASIWEPDQERTDRAAREALEYRTNLNVEFRILHPTRGIRWLTVIGQTFYDANGQPNRMTGIALDISDRKQAEQEREQLLERERSIREEAQTANRIKDEFLAVLSHELRSPLNPILGWAKLLQTRKFDESATQRALETIERNAKLQTQLIDDLLDVSRILRGKMALNIYPVNLVTVIEAALETVGLSAQAKGILIEKEFASDIELISGDSGRLQQIVWNLLSNAVKFTPSAGRIEIRLSQVGTDALLQVQDTGKGISPEFLPHVFDYFRQEDGTTTRQFGGLGLGLAIVRYLTELHGGTVQAESAGEGRGATFTVRLPLLKAQKEPSENDTISLPLASGDSPLSGLRILIVDDEADMRELILTILKPTGAAMSLAASAAEALAAWDSFQPDILISDIGMPEMDGYGLMRQVRHLPPLKGGRIPAIALTAYAGEFDRQQALAAGFQQHIAKPVEPEKLLKAIVDLTAKANRG